MNIEETIKTLNKFNKIKINSYAMQFVNISYPDLQEAIETLLTAYENEKEKNQELQELYTGALQDWGNEKDKNQKIEIIVNKLMPLAECSYWNYENHTCTHTCRGCDYLNEDNKRTSSGILIDKDRYCRLYEDGYAKEDTKFVNVEDLIKRHLKEE